MKSLIKHTLSMTTITPTLVMHGYLMCPENKHEAQLRSLIELMASEIEQRMKFYTPIFISTPLDEKGVEIVHAHLRTFPDVAAMMDKATDQHHTAWIMQIDDPMYEKLRLLHDGE